MSGWLVVQVLSIYVIHPKMPGHYSALHKTFTFIGPLVARIGERVRAMREIFPDAAWDVGGRVLLRASEY